jgi:LysR family nitrogen assimilation transcriptional regulator
LLGGGTSMRQIRYFEMITRTGSFTAASRILNISQPALGTQIKQLETHLGAHLFARHARGVALTEAGSVFLAHVGEAMDAVGRGEKAVAALRQSVQHELAIGFTPTAGRALIADLLSECSKQWPKTKLVFREGLTDDLLLMVVRGDLDLAFCYDPSPCNEIKITSLYQEDLVLVGPATVLKRYNRAIKVRELGKFPLVLGDRDHATRRFLEARVRHEEVDLSSVLEVEPITLKREMLVRHGRCSIVPYGLFQDEINTGQLAYRPILPAITRKVALVTNIALNVGLERSIRATVGSLVARRIEEGLFGWRIIAPS